MFRKNGTTFAGSFAAEAERKKKSRAMMEELEDRNFLSASIDANVPAIEASIKPRAAISATVSADNHPKSKSG